MDPLEQNLAALRGSDPAQAEALRRCSAGPDVQPFTARSGAVSLRFAGRLEASGEDPEDEGRQLAAYFKQRARDAGARRLVIFGMGVHTLRFLSDFDGDVLVIEPSTQVARSVLEHVDLADALCRVRLRVTDDPQPIASHPLFRSRERGLLLEHAPARRRAPELYERLVRQFRPGASAKRLDIAVIPPLYGGSLPVAQGCAAALRQLGHRVREIDLAPFWPAYRQLLAETADERLARLGRSLRGGLVRIIGEMLGASFELDPPDLVFALAQAPLDAPALERMAKLGIPRVLWFCEDFRVMTGWSDHARFYDLVFHLQPGSFDRPLSAAGGRGHPLPMAFDPEIHRPLELSEEQHARYACELSFIGAAYHNRVQFLPALVGLGLRIYGTGWPLVPPFDRCMPEPNQRKSAQASNLIFNASSINLNLHSSPWVDGVNPAGDYLNPRTFELAGAGAFQLVDERSQLAECFDRGVEVETFADLEECRRKILHFLERPEQRIEIGARAHRRAIAEHTYRHRMEQALSVLEAGPVALSARACAGGSVGSAIGHATDEPELREILSRVDPDLRLDAQAISLAIQGGDGPLTREEKLLLYMREARREVVIHDAKEEAA